MNTHLSEDAFFIVWCNRFSFLYYILISSLLYFCKIASKKTFLWNFSLYFYSSLYAFVSFLCKLLFIIHERNELIKKRLCYQLARWNNVKKIYKVQTSGKVCGFIKMKLCFFIEIFITFWWSTLHCVTFWRRSFLMCHAIVHI